MLSVGADEGGLQSVVQASFPRRRAHWMFGRFRQLKGTYNEHKNLSILLVHLLLQI